MQWNYERPAAKEPQTLSEQLLAEAAAEDRIAKQYDGCMFMGEHPSMPHLHRASLLRRAASEALMNERRKAKRKAVKS